MTAPTRWPTPHVHNGAQAFRDVLHQAGYEATLTQFPGVEHMRMASERHENTVWAIVTLMRE